KYNECLILLQKKYNWSTPYYMVKNKTKNRPDVESIDEKTIKAINHFNNADNQLYEIINKKVLEQIKKQPFISIELAKLALYNKLYSNEFTRKVAGGIKRKII